jgi:hypothetical protein
LALSGQEGAETIPAHSEGKKAMFALDQLAEYRVEILKRVCSRCVERPPGGPPCAPLGKRCGLELHLPEFLDAIHAVDSPLIEPYLETIRKRVCSECSFRGSECCPCPMDYLLVLTVDAVEAVDARRAGALMKAGAPSKCATRILPSMTYTSESKEPGYWQI